MSNVEVGNGKVRHSILLLPFPTSTFGVRHSTFDISKQLLPHAESLRLENRGPLSSSPFPSACETPVLRFESKGGESKALLELGSRGPKGECVGLTINSGCFFVGKKKMSNTELRMSNVEVGNGRFDIPSFFHSSFPTSTFRSTFRSIFDIRHSIFLSNCYPMLNHCTWKTGGPLSSSPFPSACETPFPRFES